MKSLDIKQEYYYYYYYYTLTTILYLNLKHMLAMGFQKIVMFCDE